MITVEFDDPREVRALARAASFFTEALQDAGITSILGDPGGVSPLARAAMRLETALICESEAL